MVGRKVRDAALQLIRWRRMYLYKWTEPTRYRFTAVVTSTHSTAHSHTNMGLCGGGPAFSPLGRARTG